MNTNGSCNVDIIERELENIDLIADNHEIVKTIVIKSTIPLVQQKSGIKNMRH